MKRRPVKKVGSEKPMKASVVAIWSKIEYGRTADSVPMGSAIRMPSSWAEPSTKSVVGSRWRISVSTLTRLAKEKPQSPRSIEENQRT